MTRAPWPTSTWKPGRALHVEAEHAVVVVAAEPVRDRRARSPTPGRRRRRRRRARSSRTSRGAAAAGSSNGASRQRERCGAARCSGRSAPRARCPARAPSPASPTARGRGRRRGTRCDSSNAVVANTTWPKPTPSVRKPPGTSGDANGVGASREARRRSRRATPHGAVVRARRATRRAARSSSAPLGDGRTRRRRGAATVASNAASSAASKPTNDGVVGRARPATITRCARSSSRQVSAPSAVGSPGTSPMTSPKNGVSDGGVGHLDAEVGELESDGSWRHSWGRPAGSVRRGGRSRAARRTSG